jgi:hypothetical protein
MTSTYLGYREVSLMEPVVAGWYDDGELGAGVLRQTADWAGGGLVSTAAELATFLRALNDGAIVQAPAQRPDLNAFAERFVLGPSGRSASTN